MSPEGTVYWMRAVHRTGAMRGVYVPREILSALGWSENTVLQVWVQGDVVCARAIPDQMRMPNFTPRPPKSWKEHAADRQISIFQEVK